ncbi:hypothetical protein BDV96DRAFT_570611 [Lophiotrema nucula]|uniref:Uncharacterized protein n=1 Tax=Lophiotrema nucula TaxID=690887 RepID=A0A6A5ZDM8_9PLEO|nr:hypothetical protein BDV96DRAFT_570611 [Lophiotrema nucula]
MHGARQTSDITGRPASHKAKKSVLHRPNEMTNHKQTHQQEHAVEDDVTFFYKRLVLCRHQTYDPFFIDFFIELSCSATMSGATAPKKQGKELNEFTMEDRRSFDSYIAEYRAKKELKENPALQAEVHGSSALVSSSSPRPKRKKSRCVVS